jgi:hypothetical protein
VALCWGEFFWGEFAGYALNGRAGSPFVALAAGTQLPQKWRARPPLQSFSVGQERAYSSARTLPGIKEAVKSLKQSKMRLRTGLRQASAICIQENWGDGQRRLMITCRS